MDIQVSSNFERLLFDAYDRDPQPIRALMGSLRQSGRFTIAAHALAEIRSAFGADRADEEETAASIRTLRREADYLLDPHTAVAFAVAEKEAGDRSTPMVVLATAHPAKFPEAIERAAGVVPQLPHWLAGLADRPERVNVLPADQKLVEHFILGASRAAQGAAA